MSHVSENSSPMGNIIRSASLVQSNEFIIDLEEFLELPSFDLEEKLNGNTTQKDKVKAESYRDPLLAVKNNQARELEDLSNLAFMGLTVCYRVMFLLYSTFLGKKDSNTGVMAALLIWTLLLMLLLILPVFIRSFIRFTFGTLKVMRLVMSGLLLVSSSFVFILLLLQLGLFKS